MLRVRRLVKVYPGSVTALAGLDLEVPPGMFGLLGPNGAGKSTFMKILAGLLEPTSGEITLGDLDVVRDPVRLREHLGYLPQEFGLYPHLSGRDMLRYLLELKGVQHPRGLKALCSELLERVNLTHAADRKVREYSGGMRQRLGIAQAIAGSPKLIVVDEPTAGLDPEERFRFFRLLAEIARTSTVILSTHLVEDVATLCPRFAVIRSGRLMTVTSPGDARARLRGAIYEGEVEDEQLDELRRTVTVTQAVLFEGRNRARIYVPDGQVPSGFDPVSPTLEDAYLVLMREEPSSTASEPAARVEAA